MTKKTTTTETTSIALRYIGGKRSLIGIPARDMDAEEVAALPLPVSALIASGLYKVVRRDTESEAAS